MPEAEGAAQRLLRELHDEIRRSGATERIAEARSFLEEDIDPKLKAAMANVIVHHDYHAGRYEDALFRCRQWQSFDPDDRSAVRTTLAVLMRLDRLDETIELAGAELAKHPGEFMFHALLGIALGLSGRIDEARAHGTLALVFKDRSAGATAADLGKVAVPSAGEWRRGQWVISYSLFGNRPRYLKGAIANVRAAHSVYPHWTCRFYVDNSVPSDVLKELASEGADVRVVEGLPRAKYGTLWRFLVADDPAAARYLVRDCDSVVSVRERLAVDDWIESGRHFHVMRDHFAHNELVLAGMWGGVAGALPSMGRAFTAYIEKRYLRPMADQEFLREVMWPTIRQSVLVHDSQFSFGERRDFPRRGRLPEGQHVGRAKF